MLGITVDVGVDFGVGVTVDVGVGAGVDSGSCAVGILVTSTAGCTAGIVTA